MKTNVFVEVNKAVYALARVKSIDYAAGFFQSLVETASCHPDLDDYVPLDVRDQHNIASVPGGLGGDYHAMIAHDLAVLFATVRYLPLGKCDDIVCAMIDTINRQIARCVKQ